MTRKIAYSELKEHAKEQDLWLLIDGKVYDVTKFYDEHPGGGDMLLGSSGTLYLPHGMKIDRSDTLQAPPSSNNEGATTVTRSPPLPRPILTPTTTRVVHCKSHIPDKRSFNDTISK